MVEKQPMNKVFNKATKDLRNGINGAILHLQEGMQEYLSNTIDLPKLLAMVQKMGLSNIIGIQSTPMPGMDYYKVLGLDKAASNNEVKQRYREIMNKLHPDKAGDEMTFLVAMVNAAYGIICKERGI